MAAIKATCPACQVRVVSPTYPAKLRCPKCGAKFFVHENGQTQLHSPDAAGKPLAAVAIPIDPALIGNSSITIPALLADNSGAHMPVNTDAYPVAKPAANGPAAKPTRGRGLRSLPKPLLFGLHGALGGLLAAVLAGELAWALLRPAATTVAPVSLAVSPTVTAYPGTTNRVVARIARQDFDGPLFLEALNVPTDVAIPQLRVPDGATEVNVHLAAGNSVAEGEYRITMRLRSHESPAWSVTQPVTLRIEAEPATLHLAVSPEIAVYAGNSNRLPVRITRQHWQGAVELQFVNAPPHVSAQPVTIAADSAEGELAITVAEGANPGTLALRVLAKAKDNPWGVSAEAMARLTIAPPPPALALAVSPGVTVYAGGSNRFGVKVSRQGFPGPLQLTVPDPPAGIKFAPLTLPAEATQGEIELAVDTKALDGGPQRSWILQVHAQAESERYLTATANLELTVLAVGPSLHVAVSPHVDVFRAGRCRFTVKVARAGFTGPVRLSFRDAPPGMWFPTAVLNADENECVVEAFAFPKAAMGKCQVQVVAVHEPAASKGKTKPEIIPPAGPPRPGPTKAPTPAPPIDVRPAMAPFTLDIKANDKATQVPPLDIVFVLDVTASMQFAINGVRDGIQNFFTVLGNNEMDVRIGLLAFRDLYEDLDAMTVLKFQGHAFTDNIELFRSEIGTLKADGGGDTPESSLDALATAAKYPFRNGAKRVLVLITDAPYKEAQHVNAGKLTPKVKANKSNPLNKGPVTMPQAVAALKSGKISQVHLITKPVHRRLYEPLQNGSTGAFFDLEEAAKGGSDFAGLLPELSREIARLSVADLPGAPAVAPPPPPPSTAAEAPPASKPPPPPSPPSVVNMPPLRAVPPAPPTVSTAVPPAAIPELPGFQTTHMFASQDWARLTLAIGVATAIVAAGIALALAGGQQLYLRHRWLSAGNGVKVVSAGLAAGLLGGSAGQLFFQLSSGGSGWFLLSRVLAWTILGGLLGAPLAWFVPNLKWHRALLGGCLGGFTGALGFTAVSVLGEMLGRFAGAALLGFCIGLMIGLTELAFRRYWLEISFGPRETRTVTLGATPVTVGSNEAAVTVCIPGAPALAGSFRLEGEHVLYDDAANGQRTIVQPGHCLQLGSVTIALCSSASAQKVGITLHLPTGRAIHLSEGMPLTADDLPGLVPQGRDGVVALLSRRPSDPRVLIFRNRSTHAWQLTAPDGTQECIHPGLGLELKPNCKIDFGTLHATTRHADSSR